MTSIATAIRKLASRSDDEIEALLADDEEKDQAVTEVDFGAALPGKAAGRLEVWLADAGQAVEQDGLLWYPMIRSGQWAVRPGPRGQKVRRPLKVIAGHSKDQRKEIGLADLKSAFDDQAIEFVTVPESHDNKPLENTGFIDAMRIQDAKVSSGPNKGKSVPHLFGGYRFTDKTAKQKVLEGSVAGRSCGILYDYVATETGTKYPAVVEHVALTNRQWITGMAPFGRKLSDDGDGAEIVPLRLSDDEPEPEDVLLGEPVLDLDATTTVGSDDATWDQEESPNWLRQQVQQILDAKREERRQKARAKGTDFISIDVGPYYSCREAVPGKALVSDGYGDDANFWVANITVADSAVTLAPFTDWRAYKKAYVPDDERKPPPKDKQPLSQDKTDKTDEQAPPLTLRDRLVLAQARRAKTKTSGRQADHETDHPRGGEDQHMSDMTGNVAELSEQARAAVQAAEDRARAVEAENKRLSEQVARLSGSVAKSDADAYVTELSAAGLQGQPGVLAEVRNIMLADDGEPAVVSEAFSEDGSTEVSLSVGQVVRRIFDAFKRGEDGRIALGEQLAPPSEKPKEGDEEKLGDDGKPKKGDGDGEQLSAAQKADAAVKENPSLASVVGPPISNGSTDGGAS